MHYNLQHYITTRVVAKGRRVSTWLKKANQWHSIDFTGEHSENMRVLDCSSRTKCVELVADLILLGVVLTCWFYVLYAGRVATIRYLEKIDFSEPVERITVLQLMKHSENTTSSALNAN